MNNTEIVNRIAALPNLEKIPLMELEWLVEHGRLEMYDAGTILAPKGKRIEKLWLIIVGRVAVQVDRGIGPRLVVQWHAGDVSGILPYSRMIGPPGNNYCEIKSEILTIHETHFTEMINKCPVFTAYTVHTMLDRARQFNASDLQDEKMISLGKLAAGLAHEINNPASAIVRSAKQLLVQLADVETAFRTLGAKAVTDDMFSSIQQLHSACFVIPANTFMSPIQRAEKEDEIADWLVRRKLNKTDAEQLSNIPIDLDTLENLTEKLSGKTLAFTLHWISASCSTSSLVIDIERAANQISELVTAIKRFTYMDNLSRSEAVDVEAGLRDTIKVLAAKSKSKQAVITLDVQDNLPRVRAIGSELNQVWMNLLDNALDAIAVSGNIHISARMKLDRLMVKITDDGPGIPTEILSKIFDPFFTTKPPGQGTGLGLDIARRLLRLYQGDINFQSKPGKTECRVSLIVEKQSSAVTDQL